MRFAIWKVFFLSNSTKSQVWEMSENTPGMKR